jgi:hypothetical protein
MAIKKAKYYFKRTNDFISRGLCDILTMVLTLWLQKIQVEQQEAIKLFMLIMILYT